MELVYLETTFISYLVALPARDILIAAHQQVTRDWWQLRRDQFRCAANAQIVKRIQRICDDRGFEMPFICTPEELLEETEDEG
jgi:hypothetical protein